MFALTIRQPWTHAILNLGKDIENRDWHTKFRGRVAVHSSKKLDINEGSAFMLAMNDHLPKTTLAQVANLWNEQKLLGGYILGTVEIVDCVKASDSKWFFGDYGFVLRNPVKLFEPIPCRGALGFWQVPKDVEAKILEQI